MSMWKENKAVKLGIAGCIDAQWLSGSWFNFFKLVLNFLGFVFFLNISI